MENQSLIELVRAKNDLELKIIEAGGELTEILETIDNDLKSNIEVKMGNYCYYMDALSTAIDSWYEDGQKRVRIAKGLGAVLDRIKSNFKDSMLLLGRDLIESGDYRVTLSRSKPRLVITNELALPSKYKISVTTYEVDKNKLKEDLEFGTVLDGAHLEGGSALRYTLNRGKK